MPESDWEKVSQATFCRDKDINREGEKGEWRLKKGMPEQWYITYQFDNLNLSKRIPSTPPA
jgi:23S rRNA (cytosine1962-C5)-methyltransferase